MKLDEPLLEVLEELSGNGWDEVEVFHKKGRSRSLRWSPSSAVASFRQEEGWAVRAGDRRRSFYYAAAGPPRAGTPWPEADGRGLRLPSARPVPTWTPPSDLDAPLSGENEMQGLFDAVARELASELAGARLVVGYLDDGSSQSQLASSREVRARVRHRSASLRLEALGPEAGTRAALDLAARAARGFSPASLARRLADRLTVTTRGGVHERDRGEFVLAPGLAVTLVAALADLWIGPEAEGRARALVDRRGRLASAAVTLIDDGRLPGGLAEAPVDGEGQPTREVTLVEQGSFRQPLLAWWQSPSAPRRASGCSRRSSWRDLPWPGATHLYLQPDPGIRAGELLADLSRGYYLLASEGPVRLGPDRHRFAVPVAGFAIAGGRSIGPVAGAWLVGSVPALLGGVTAVARDLAFFPALGGLVGAPSLRVRGLELRPSP